MKGKVTVAPRIRVETKEFYAEHFHTPHSGIAFVIESFPDIYRWTLRDVLKLFSSNEQRFIKEAMKDAELDPNTAGELIIPRCRKLVELYSGERRFQVAWDDLEKKLESLPRCFGIVLEIWACSAHRDQKSPGEAPVWVIRSSRIRA